ncbi:transcriptional regulator [Sulfitobacter sp. SK012]|uniref:LacI family DNA-binding transcriptional regulator n=1 Tax=Sulfitobacter sp. SK012 TaxID=1389005 RepID=UPI000E0BC76D|nr:LacI family DNA-binding transcriptional regulator [Sulfitobacter sp. SK012]AXI46495.1 transcriptional regulator [Sulfitobacter sp. SK012]
MADSKQNKVDIFAVAKRAKVSISTVSRSYNHPELVNPATRKKIDAAVRKLGYIRNRAAQTMHGIRSGTIGLVVPTIDHAIFAEVIQAFSDSVDEHGFTILIASHGYDLEREYAVLRKFLEHRVDGVAIIGEDHSEETYELIERQNIQAISIWNYTENSRLSCVGADNEMAGSLAAQHLADLSHLDIGLVFPPTTDNDRARDRRSGAQSILTKVGAHVHPQWDIESSYSIADAKDAALQILKNKHRPSAILCGNDVLAMGVLYAARRCGLSVPEDLSIIGIGDFKGSNEVEPGLTTIRLPAREIGRQAGEHLSRSIIGELTERRRVSCDIALIERGTCKHKP